ncbi:MAG: hypothetical protein ACUVSL_02775 [Chloroflexus sp.]
MRDYRTFFTIVLASLVGWITAVAVYIQIGDNRNPEVLRWLALVILITPLSGFFGWIAIRRYEWRLAAACCGALYFFTPFVAARIETIISPDAARQTVGPHTVYFVSVLILHLFGGLALAWWRGR